jgi:hypothetical protein
MRRVPLFLLILLPFTTFASAQTQQVNPAQSVLLFGAPAGPTAVSDPEIVVARLMTFDRDRDGLVVKSELPERMHNLIAADASGDGALDRAEIRKLATPLPVHLAAAAATVPGFAGGRVGGGGGYTFGDQVSLSTRSHVEGALDDLKLPAATRDQALGIIRPFMDRLEADASAVLLKEVEDLLKPHQFETFKLSIDRQLSTREAQIPLVRTQPDGTKFQIFIRRGPDPAQLINTFGLRGEDAKAANAALDGFKARIRPGDVDREALLDELDGVLSREERENFGAALQRRPLVKADAGMAGVVSGFVDLKRRVERQGIVDGRAIFTMPFPPEKPVLQP